MSRSGQNRKSRAIRGESVPRNASRKRTPTGRPAVAVPTGQAHTFVIEIPNSLKLRIDGIERNHARLA